MVFYGNCVLKNIDFVPNGTFLVKSNRVLEVMVLYFGYHFLFEYFLNRTPAKFITKTIVVDVNGNKPNMKEIFLRNISRLIPFDNLSFLFGEVWRDSISETTVIYKKWYCLQHGFLNKQSRRVIWLLNDLCLIYIWWTQVFRRTDVRCKLWAIIYYKLHL